MSIPLPTVSLASQSVGQSGNVSFANTGIGAGGVSSNPVNVKNAGTILIYNESGSGLLIKFQSSSSGFYLPAGAWQPIQIGAGETGYQWTIIYNLPNPPVTQLLTTYYYPGEPIPPQPTLGNSPIGIGGTVATSSIQTLSNENNPFTLVIDIGQSVVLITINNDGTATWKVLQGGVAHQAFVVSSTGNPLQLGGSTSDTVEVLSKLQTDGAVQFNVTFPPVTQMVKIDAAGLTLQNGTINLLAGSVSRMTIDGPFNIATAGTTVNHSLGVIPDFVFPISDTGNSASSGFYGVNFGTMTTTQVTLYCSFNLARTWILSFKK